MRGRYRRDVEAQQYQEKVKKEWGRRSRSARYRNKPARYRNKILISVRSIAELYSLRGRTTGCSTGCTTGLRVSEQVVLQVVQQGVRVREQGVCDRLCALRRINI